MRAAQVLIARDRGELAQHLDRHRAELNVAVGDLALWAESFGDGVRVDAAPAIVAMPGADAFEWSETVGRDLFLARERLKSQRTEVLAELRRTRTALAADGFPVNELTGYRRTLRLWAGEAIDLVTGAHRLVLADQYLRRIGDLHTTAGDDAAVHRRGVSLIGEWMADLEQADREDELELAQVCGYGEFVEHYRTGG